MQDCHPFEYKLFQLISQDFPYLEYLYVRNDQPQQHKQDSSTLLTFLCLESAHVDYVEHLLLKKNAHLPRLSTLRMKSKLLAMIPNNFTTDVVTLNFDRVKELVIINAFVRPHNFHQYFPSL